MLYRESTLEITIAVSLNNNMCIIHWIYDASTHIDFDDETNRLRIEGSHDDVTASRHVSLINIIKKIVIVFNIKSKNEIDLSILI